MIPLIELVQQLVAKPSVTPNDKGCQSLLCQHLKCLDFAIEHFPFAEVNNFWARRGKKSPLLVFIGHTDVVPAGPLEKWETPPFMPTIRNGQLYGRGSADMKGSLAAMLVACRKFIHDYPHHHGSIAWLITSDEEGPGIQGIAKVTEVLKKRNEKIDYCLVGEPTCEKKLGDTLKIGRRGSLSAHLIVKGKQAHIAYPQLSENPIHQFSPLLVELLRTDWDDGIKHPHFQPTRLQFSNIQGGVGVNNVTPDCLDVKFNFRYSPATTSIKLKNTVENILKKHLLKYQINWEEGGFSFLSPSGQLRLTCLDIIKNMTGIVPTISTTGGTSDGRFIASMGAEIVEFGPCNQTIHQINECVSIEELEKLSKIYEEILKKILLQSTQ
ncbi:succinyl-diaminopimelate desuccinylase [Rickettsiella grylli]|uniref:succinyl-diaminopimelate desuccinylase n=1 Tax=Rickettsiella grylli TaxID=59196 RepID=UPI0008FD454C|nr:succinyl-diaminopimelate desuccinylase [Rickettsiella grylli]OJA00508.1 succinyl-diaminopimelate desuccinylase [Rickettsiella grylli]